MTRPPTFPTLLSTAAARAAHPQPPPHATGPRADDGMLRLAAFALLLVALGALVPPLVLATRRPA